MLIGSNLRNRSIFFSIDPTLITVIIISVASAFTVLCLGLFLIYKVIESKKLKKLADNKKQNKSKDTEEEKILIPEEQEEEEKLDEMKVFSAHPGEINLLGEAGNIKFKEVHTENPNIKPHEGNTVIDDKDNNREIQGVFVKGKPEGVIVEKNFKKDNKPGSLNKKKLDRVNVSQYVDGVKEGHSIEYFQALGAAKKTSGMINDNLREGKTTIQHGGYSYEGNYMNGVKNGPGEEFYRGKKIFKGIYQNGNRYHGTEYCDGKKVYEGYYLNGVRNGEGKIYDHMFDDNPIKFDGLIVNNKPYNGKCLEYGAIEEEKDGQLVKKPFLQKEHSICNGIEVGASTEYDSVGRVVKNINYDDNGIIKDELKIEYNGGYDTDDIKILSTRNGRKRVFEGDIIEPIKPGNSMDDIKFDNGVYETEQQSMSGKFKDGKFVNGILVYNNGFNNVCQLIGDIEQKGLNYKLIKGVEIKRDGGHNDEFKVTQKGSGADTDLGYLPCLLNEDCLSADGSGPDLVKIKAACDKYNAFSVDEKKKFNKEPKISLAYDKTSLIPL